MRRIHVKKVAVVFAQTAEDFEEKMNSRLAVTSDLASDHKIVYNICDGGFSASIEYSIFEQLPDCARDELELRGEFLSCMDCPHLTNETDGKGHHKCIRGKTMPGMRACDWFCEKYIRGEECRVEYMGEVRPRRDESKGAKAV